MFKLSYYIVLSIISVAMYLASPMAYSRPFCTACLLVFILVFFPIAREDYKRINILNFNLLFFFSFFACTYVYPVFLVGGNSIIGALITASINTMNTINRTVSLSTLAISVYGLSYCIFRNKTGIQVTYENQLYASRILTSSRLLTAVICFAMIVVLYSYQGTVEINDHPYLFLLFYYVLPIFFVASSIHYKNEKNKPLVVFVKHNSFLLFLLLIILTLFIFIGDRLPIITISLIILVTVSLYVKPIKASHLLFIGLIGVVLMFSLRVTRTSSSSSLSSAGVKTFIESSSSSIAENASPWDLLADLVGIGMELNDGMDYVDRNGFLSPAANAVITIFSPFPLVPTFLSQTFFGKLPKDIAPVTVISEYTDSAAGNHCVIDLYMPFGVIGVVVVFFLFGWMIAIISNGLNKDLFCKIFYVYLASVAIFVARNSITNLYRSIAFVFFIYYILLLVNNSKKRSANNYKII